MPDIEIPKKYRSPKLMVVGDSLAQGCRSLSVSKDLCAQSYGSVLAESQGWDYIAPTHPQPVVMDVEDIIRRADDLLTFVNIRKRIDKNIQAWVGTFESPPSGTSLCFDNVAIAGSTTAQFIGHTAKTWRKEFRNKLATYDKATGLVDKLGAAGALHFSINGQFTLNPTGDAAFDDLTQLDWAFARKPETLVVHFGHNDGLYPIGGYGQIPESGLAPMKKAYLEGIKQALSAPAEIGHLVIILLPKISCVANLVPEGDRLPDGFYHESYKTAFPYEASILGKDLAEMDAQIKAINGEARTLIGPRQAKRRITVIDTYQVFSKYDFKNTGSPSAQIRIEDALPIDNRYLEGRIVPETPLPGGGNLATRPTRTFKQGGFQSIDGMHPSAVGYAAFAVELANEMNLPRNKEAILKKALKKEKLITDFPSPLPGFIGLVNLIKDIFDKPDKTEDDEKTMFIKKAAPICVASIAREFQRR